MAWKQIVSMKRAVEAFIVKVDGKIDIRASDTKFHDYLIKHNAKQADEQEREMIVQCINSLYDDWRGTCLNADYIKSQVVERIKKINPDLSDPALFSVLSKNIVKIVKDMAGEHIDKPLAYDKRVGYYRKSDHKTSS